MMNHTVARMQQELHDDVFVWCERNDMVPVGNQAMFSIDSQGRVDDMDRMHWGRSLAVAQEGIKAKNQFAGVNGTCQDSRGPDTQGFKL